MRSLISKNQFLSVSLKNSLQVIVRFVIGVLNIKVIAWYVGPTGMALVSQLQNALQISVNLSGGGISKGIIKYVSQYYYSPVRQGLVISTGIIVVFLLSLIIGIIVFIIPSYISGLIFESGQYVSVIKYSGIYLITTALLNLFVAIVNGQKRLKLFILINVFLSVSGFFVAFGSVYFYGLQGLMWGMLFQTTLTFFFGVWIILRVVPARKIVFSNIILKRFSKYSLMAIVSGVVTPLTILIIRNIIISHESLHGAGLWDGVNKISNNYIMLVTMSFSYYFLPTFSKIADNDKLKKEVLTAYKILIPLLFLGGLSLYLLKEPIITLLFSDQFQGMHEIIKWQILGDVFKVLSWVIGILLVAKEKVYMFLITEVVSVLLQISLAYWFVILMGIEGSTFFYFIENVIYFAVMLSVFYYYWGRPVQGLSNK